MNQSPPSFIFFCCSVFRLVGCACPTTSTAIPNASRSLFKISCHCTYVFLICTLHYFHVESFDMAPLPTWRTPPQSTRFFAVRFFSLFWERRESVIHRGKLQTRTPLPTIPNLSIVPSLFVGERNNFLSNPLTMSSTAEEVSTI